MLSHFNSFNKLNSYFPGKSVEEIRNECRMKIRNMPRVKILRWSYIPFCLAEGCWDIADSVINIAGQMRLNETKPLSRSIRSLRRSYEIKRQATAISDKITFKMAQEGELTNYLTLESCDQEKIDSIYNSIKKTASEKYPELSVDHIVLLGAVYHCHILLQVLFRYVKLQTELMRRELGLPYLDDILPNEIYELDKIIMQFAGNKQFIIPEKENIVHSVVNDLMKAQFTDINESKSA